MRYVGEFTTFLLLACSCLFAQIAPAHREIARLDAAMTSVSEYCREIDAFEHSHEPLLLASVAPDAIDGAHWRRYETRAEWEKGSKPVPAALAWTRNGKVVAVRLAFQVDGTGIHIADYCFREDGTLAKVGLSVRLEQQWNRPRMYAKVKVARTWFFAPDGRRIAEVQRSEPTPLEAEKTDFIYIQPPLFRNVAQLPFVALLYSGT